MHTPNDIAESLRWRGVSIDYYRRLERGHLSGVSYSDLVVPSALGSRPRPSRA